MNIQAIGILSVMFSMLVNAVEAQDNHFSASTGKHQLILLSTEWCGYCQLQKKQIKRSDKLSAAGFKYTELDAEGSAPIRFKNRLFNAKPPGEGYHELVKALVGDGELSFPTWILLNERQEVVARYNGVLSNKQIEQLLPFLSDTASTTTINYSSKAGLQ